MKNKFFIIIGIIIALIIGFMLGNVYGDKTHSFSTNDGVNGVAIFENISDGAGYGIEFEEGQVPLNIAIYDGTLHLKIAKGEKTIYEEDFDKWQDITVDIPEAGFYQVLLSGKKATGIVKYPAYENSGTENVDIISEIFDNETMTNTTKAYIPDGVEIANTNDNSGTKAVDIEFNRSPENVTIKVIEDTISRDSASILITDNNEDKYGWGEEFGVQEKANGEWKDLDYISDNLSWIDIAYELNDNQLTQKLNIKGYYGELSNGIYRIVKRVYDNGYVSIYSDEFEIK